MISSSFTYDQHPATFEKATANPNKLRNINDIYSHIGGTAPVENNAPTEHPSLIYSTLYYEDLTTIPAENADTKYAELVMITRT